MTHQGLKKIQRQITVGSYNSPTRSGAKEEGVLGDALAQEGRTAVTRTIAVRDGLEEETHPL